MPQPRISVMSLGRADACVAVILFLAGLAAFWPARSFAYISYDDPGYASENPPVQQGITSDSVQWAMTTFHGGFYLPLTWLSLMADVNIFGDNAAGHHTVNIVLHAANGVLLYLALLSLTGSRLPSAFVAAAFLLHPLRVESVAWVTERKDVLSGFFGLLAIILFTWFTRTRRWPFNLLASLLFALSLLAKPMLVMLPVVLLLLDFWPLRRVAIDAGVEGPPGTAGVNTPRRVMLRLIVEKLPLAILSLVAAIVAYLAATQSGSVLDAEHEIPLTLRLANAVVSYGRYLLHMVWWQKLAVFYPYPAAWGAGTVVGVAVILVLVTLLCVLGAKRYPWLIVGWLWFVVSMIPMIGIVQSGDQSMADRFTYFPMIGVLTMIGWSIPQWERMPQLARKLTLAGALGALATMAAGMHIQLGYWHDDMSLFGHAVAVTSGNSLAHAILGRAKVAAGDEKGGISEFKEALRISPADDRVCVDLGIQLARAGDADGALQQFRRAVNFNDSNPDAHFDLALTLMRHGDRQGAMRGFERAIQLDPSNAVAAKYLAQLRAQASAER